MFKCIECGAVFEEPATWEEDRGEFWGFPCTETVRGCPECKGDYEEVFKCRRCDGWWFEDELKGKGRYCEYCYDELFN